MKVIKDERLIIKNLKNIRIAFIFQTICMIGMLIYEGITNGFMNAFNHPLCARTFEYYGIIRLSKHYYFR